MFITTVDQHTQLFTPNLGTPESKNKQHAIDNVTLPASVGTDNAGEILRGHGRLLSHGIDRYNIIEML